MRIRTWGHGMGALALCLLLLGGAAQARAGAPDPEEAGRLLSLRYEYGSFFEGYVACTLYPGEDGRTWLETTSYNGLEYEALGPVDEAQAARVEAALAEGGVFAWNGFAQRDEDILDGFSFSLEADFEHGTVTASGYMRYPQGFEQGHALLSQVLLELTQEVGMPEETETPAQ